MVEETVQYILFGEDMTTKLEYQEFDPPMSKDILALI